MQMGRFKSPSSRIKHELKDFISSCGHVGMDRKEEEIEGQKFFVSLCSSYIW